jgi:hypothetical protein
MSIAERLRDFEKVMSGRVDIQEKTVEYTKDEMHHIQKLRDIPNSVALLTLSDLSSIKTFQVGKDPLDD